MTFDQLMKQSKLSHDELIIVIMMCIEYYQDNRSGFRSFDDFIDTLKRQLKNYRVY